MMVQELIDWLSKYDPKTVVLIESEKKPGTYYTCGMPQTKDLKAGFSSETLTRYVILKIR